MKSVARLALILSLLPAVAVATAGNTYLEDFTSDAYRHPTTTANWDTTSALLHLYPFAPGQVGTLPALTNALALERFGQMVAVARGANGIQLCDVSDAASPVALGSYVSTDARDVAIDGFLLFVADGSDLVILDISDPATPSHVATLPIGASALSVDVAAPYAYVGTSAGLTVVDVAAPASPVIVGSVASAGSLVEVVVSGAHVFAGNATTGLETYDVSTPALPAIAGTLPAAGLTGIVIAADDAYVAAGNSVMLVDVSNPSVPAMVSSIPTSPGATGRLAVSGGIVYVANGTDGVVAIDYSNPLAPFEKHRYAVATDARDVLITGEFGVIANGAAGLEIARLRRLSQPMLASTTAGLVMQRMVTDGRYAYAATVQGLQIYDLSDPATPVLVGGALVGVGSDVLVDGNLAYLATTNAGLFTIDITDPTAPVVRDSYPGNFSGVDVRGDHAFLTSTSVPFHSLDISDPDNIALAATLPAVFGSRGIDISGDYAFVAASGLFVVDIATPTAPAVAAGVTVTGTPSNIVVDGEIAYVALLTSVGIYDVSDPLMPALVSTVPAVSRNAVPSGSELVVGGFAGFSVFDITNPAAPVQMSGYAGATSNFCMTSGEYALSLSGSGGFETVKLYDSVVDPLNNVGRSTPVDNQDDNIVRVRFMVDDVDVTTWRLTANSGTNFQSATPDWQWIRMNVIGNQLEWKAELFRSGTSLLPAVNEVDLEWLTEPAMIDAIVDTPDDDGGWVTINFTRSGYDFAGEASPLVGYNLLQQVSSAALAAEVRSAPVRQLHQADGAFAYGDDVRVTTLGSRTFVEMRGEPGAKASASVVWEIVGSVFAAQQHTYAVAVPTVGDGVLSTYAITAHALGSTTTYLSPEATGMSSNDLPPPVPSSIVVDRLVAGNQLDWQPINVPDFQYFNVYRSTDPGFVAAPGNLYAQTPTNSWFDATAGSWTFYYKVSAVDAADNESAAGEPDVYTGADHPAAPVRTALYPSAPNPAGPLTAIRYDVASAGAVRLSVYDVQGRLVRTLVDRFETPGSVRLTWDGKDANGHSVASGIYLLRLSAPGYSETRKITFVR